MQGLPRTFQYNIEAAELYPWLIAWHINPTLSANIHYHRKARSGDAVFMEAKFWHQIWNEGKIGFHQSEINKRLIKFWPMVAGKSAGSESIAAAQSCVFVPLCGKSQDIYWLHQQGHQILGIDLSEKAVQAFFDDNQLACKRDEIDGFVRFTGTGDADGITLLAGDFFALQPSTTAHCSAFYDRAALVAMPEAMRAHYAEHLVTLVPTESHGLLLAIAYDQARMQGPPFSVSDENLRVLLRDGFDIHELAHFSGPERVGNLAKRGLETLDERVYLLSRK